MTKIGDKHCGSGDKTILVCHVISQDHVTKGESNMADATQG